MSASDFTTLDNVKGWLGLDPSQTTDDALLTRLITAASGFIRTWCNRDFVSQSYIETRNGTGARMLALANTPITEVDSVSVDGAPIPAGGLQTPGFTFSATMLVLNGYRFTRGLANVQITYVAGYATVPDEIEQACIELVSFRYRERARIGVSSEAMAASTSSYQVRDVPPSVATLLNLYKKVVPV